MIVKIKDIENSADGKLTLDFDEEISELDNARAYGTLEVVDLYNQIKLTGLVHVNLSLECDRCLEIFNFPADVKIDETFVKGSIFDENIKELEITDENFVEELKDKDEIDLTDLVYQSIILNVPSKKLCKTECVGTQEYQNLKDEVILDPRLEVFKKFHEREEDK